MDTNGRETKGRVLFCPDCVKLVAVGIYGVESHASVGAVTNAKMGGGTAQVTHTPPRRARKYRCVFGLCVHDRLDRRVVLAEGKSTAQKFKVCLRNGSCRLAAAGGRKETM